nr:2Fe-2S iron-sulfur cluster binding domain-containing protein [Propionibacterium sp.]
MSVLTVLPDNVSVRAKPGETILAVLSASGYGYRIGCRRGGCGICKVDLREGEVYYDHPVAESVLSQEEIAAGAVLSCRAVPVGDVTIELRDERLKLNSALLRSIRAVKAPTTKE